MHNHRKEIHIMVQILEPRPQRPHPNLTLHCGAHLVELDQVSSVHTPAATHTWTPIPHHLLIQTVQKTLAATNLKIGTQAHSLTHDGSRYFGLMEIMGQKSHEDYTWVLGLRNSHDKMFPAGIVAGSQVFICDNLAFAGEIKFARKHTRFINRDLQAHDLIIRACDVGVCSNRLIPAVLHEWREPRHSVFEGRNVWSLFNSFTEALKDGNLNELPKRTEALHGLLDVAVGLN
jgi:hypothetical protein